jgi:hypothetical protein
MRSAAVGFLALNLATVRCGLVAIAVNWLGWWREEWMRLCVEYILTERE